MERRDWLILLLGVGEASALDPVRIQKGMFLLSQEAGLEDGEAYSFRPYDYGPFSSQIYHDLDDLVDEGVVAAEAVPGYTWSRYRLTAFGLAAAQEIVDQLDPARRASARSIISLKQDVLSQSFNELLKHVYSRYPDYAERSVFSG